MWFNAVNNPSLTCIQVDAGIIGNVPADWAKDATADYNEICNVLIQIPDAAFEQALIELRYDGNVGDPTDGFISESDALAITDLEISDKNISSLSGIEHFASLQFL